MFSASLKAEKGLSRSEVGLAVCDASRAKPTSSWRNRIFSEREHVSNGDNGTLANGTWQRTDVVLPAAVLRIGGPRLRFVGLVFR